MVRPSSSPKPSLNIAVGLVGAVLYGVAFAYFAHTTLYALAEDVPTYQALWSRLDALYTVHGALMILGVLMIARPTLGLGTALTWRRL